VDQHNVRTLAAYEACVPQYLASAPLVLPPVLVEWLETVLAPYPRARVLEIGSGPGKIAEHLIERGHEVTLTDATAAFVEHLREQGHPAQSFNVLTDPVPKGHQIILANAVFLHLTRPQLASTLSHLLAGLPDGGRLAFTVKQGEGEEWSTAKLGVARYFCYWQPGPLHDLVMAAGFTSVQVTHWAAGSGQPFLAVIADAGQTAAPGVRRR
jgi:2-polyprenyl-3-methyl-5-hydroxy-6-metoxy-1,4-benzoquinol methylase